MILTLIRSCRRSIVSSLFLKSQKAMVNTPFPFIQSFMAHAEHFCICDLELSSQLYLMASSSSSPPRTWRYHVFASFHGQDVRKTFLSHLRKEFSVNGITMFDDQRIERSQTIAPALSQAIRESRISIIVFSKNYASSGWCLNELAEILECQQDMGHIVMTIFYGVDPSDVRNQTGDFGSDFNENCARKTEEERQTLSEALNDAGNIAGEHLLKWDNESKMVEKIAEDVSCKLNATPSKDFKDMVGLEEHLKKVKSLLHLDNEDRAMIVGITGPIGIGKTTIARALHSLLSSSFQLSCFMENLRGSYNIGLDEYGLKLRLQEQLLSKIFNQNGMRIGNIGAVENRLCKLKVLIILDDVNDVKQLKALADETTWFGPGSRIIVTTEDQELLQHHRIYNIYHVGFPSEEEALEILCRYAFKKNHSNLGFKELAQNVTKLCGNLPLGLRVVGSSLCGKKEEWKEVIRRLDTILNHRDIEEVLRIGYESLQENAKSLFLHIAVFFNHKDEDLVKAMLADNNLDVQHWLNILVSRSLIYKTTEGEIVMHKLLQQMGRQAIHRQEPWKRQILIDAQEIYAVFENDIDTRAAVSGISFDTSRIIEVFINGEALRRLRQLRFLRVYKSRYDKNARVHIPPEMAILSCLKLLHWEEYPQKSLPLGFCTKYLVELCMQESQLERLWEGTQPLRNLKKMDLTNSMALKELPDLSNATNLVILKLNSCTSLVELPSSIANLHKLELLEMLFCIRLQVVPTHHFNLASLRSVNMSGCRKLKKCPDISRNILTLTIADTMLEELPKSIGVWSSLQILCIYGSSNTLSNLSQKLLYRSGGDIEKIPSCIKHLDGLEQLYIYGCPKLATLPELPRSLRKLIEETCESLETVSFPFPIEGLRFSNCFKLAREARRVIMRQSVWACLPGRKVLAEFEHRAIGNSFSIHSDFFGVRICVVVSPKQQMRGDFVYLLCRTSIRGCPVVNFVLQHIRDLRAEHLCISHSEFLDGNWPKLDNEILFEFFSTSTDIDIIECGVQILTKTAEERSDQVWEDDNDLSYEVLEDSQNTSDEEDDDKGNEDAYCWSWFILCFDLSHIMRKIGSLGWGTRQ